ncbi:MAG: metalloregulator ArsR/SmtB family transcription factor [Candidatus Peribacteraceae bacterium]|jgi:DNA-binding transcriptional ArsR family regulator|nr:metalloregulator ArsR/SmtB family transcription factor [Candidatus Peribacteraceae bacterium]
MGINIRNTEQKLKAIANARRLVILREMKAKNSMTVTDIAEAIKLDLAPTSFHLRILKAAGIIEYKRRGRFITYRLSLKQEEPIKKIISML